MCDDESPIVVLPPPVDGNAMPPDAQIHAAVTDPIGGHPIRQADSHVGIRAGDQLIQPIEQRAMHGGCAIDVTEHLSSRTRTQHTTSALPTSNAATRSMISPVSRASSNISSPPTTWQRRLPAGTTGETRI